MPLLLSAIRRGMYALRITGLFGVNKVHPTFRVIAY